MATLTRSNSRVNNPIYKDYVNFLASYKTGKREEENADGGGICVKNFPLSNSSASTSSSSLSSDVTDFSKNTCTPYNTFLENSKNKKFGSVKPKFEHEKVEQESEGEKKERTSMKSEIYIEIQPAKSVSEVSKIFEKQDRRSPPKSTNQINSRISIFEKQISTDNKPKLANKPVLNKSPPPPKIDIYKDASQAPPKVDICEASPPPQNTVEVVKVMNVTSAPPPPPMPSVSVAAEKPVNGVVNASSPPPPPPPPSHPARLQATLVRGPQTRYQVHNPNGTLPTEIDRNDPLVKKLVYGTLRGLYGAYHDKANDMLATLPKNMVVRSNGVQDRIEQIAQQSRLPGAGPGFESSFGEILTPPSSNGHIPSAKLEFEIPSQDMDPPPCVQNAMMKQDKKPFTYTPGGIDLSEIKSPRMARRIERNANYTGAPEGVQCPRPGPQPSGPLPPSALAAMQPQMHVQVFPSGPPPPPPGPRGGPPPPPPPMSSIPPPPPPPTCPLPTQKVTTSENQVLERPDMTRIIPDNPMAMLRKTGGPQPRPSLMDEIYGNKSVKSPPTQQQRSPPMQQGPRWPQAAPQPNHQQPPQQQWSPPVPQQWSPPTQQEPPRYQPKVIERNEQPSPPVQPEPQRYQPRVIERVPSQEEQVKTSTAHLGSLYIPPINQQPQQRSVASPPLPPKRDDQSPQIQSPGTPTLKEAPRPWQKQQKQAEELPPWAKKEPIAQPQPQIEQEVMRQPPPFQQQQQRPQQQQQRVPVQQPQNNQQPAPNAVYVTQPLVFQHPGPPPNRQQQPPQPRVDAQGAIIIPVQIDRMTPNKPATPGTPGNERSLNRQQSWGPIPPQSNSFKVLQKITQTGGEDEDEEAPVIEHGPRYPQQFQQTPPVEQMRKLKLSEGDRELMNRFRQEEEDPRYRGGLIPSRVFRILDESGVDDDTSLHNEVDPRYRGPAIPSKAFKLLQSMTDGSPDGATVSRGPTPSGNRTPQVRNIPIQIERDDQPKNYVHPSEQTVPEPKKYTGSSIPSRSFKILQAMTAPDNCANANEVNENYDPSSYNQWAYDPNYPPPYPPYWQDYYYNYYYPNDKPESNERDVRQTPVPYWGYYPPPPSPYPYVQRPLRTPTAESDSETARNTPLPWGYYPYYAPTPTREMEEWEEGNPNTQQNFAQPPPSPYPYPPYWDPYYYYYGYPPVYSPYSFYEPNENEEVAGYSSTDEMAYFSRKIKNEREESEREESKTPQVLVTPSLPQDLKRGTETESERDSSESDTETEVETEEERFTTKRSQSSNGLQAIRSVKDIKVYAEEVEQNSDEEQDEDCSEETEENEDSVSYIVDEEAIPHQLSVIYEESERSDSRRECSVLSDSTTIAERSDGEEDEESSIPLSVKLPLKIKIEASSNEATVIVGESEINVEEEEEEEYEDGEEETGDTFATFTIKPPAEKAEPETEAVICASDEDKTIPKEETKQEREEHDEDDQDWWGILNKDDDVLPVRTKLYETYKPEDVQNKEVQVEDDARSTSSSDSSSSESSSASKKEVIDDSSSESEESESDDDSDVEQINDVNNNANQENPPETLSIKERIQALKDSINSKREKIQDEIKLSVKDKVSAIEAGASRNNSKKSSTKSSVKSMEEFSEEEGDSGVTSDMSRHISDNEEFSELKKMTRYERAATHSRLFKLLQEVCEGEEDDDDDDNPNQGQETQTEKKEEAPRRDQLTLPLNNNTSDESFSSSGITSPGSPVSERLVTELVQSILKKKKGQMFRNVPKEKLQAAARRILMEELDETSTPDSSFFSPLRNSTESSTPAQTPQEFYNDYKQYYDSWSDAELLYNENYDILPSKAFRLLQEHSGSNKTGAIAGLLAKCPKILSSKNVHQELLKLIEESSETPSSTDKSLEPSEVSSAS